MVSTINKYTVRTPSSFAGLGMRTTATTGPRPADGRRVAIYGGGEVGARLLDAVLSEPNVQLVGVFDDRSGHQGRRLTIGAISGTLDDLIEASRSTPVADEILIGLPPSARARIHGIALRLSALPVDVSVCADAAEWGDNAPAATRTIGGQRTTVILAGSHGLYTRFVKGAVDRCIALAAIILLLPLLAAIALAVRLESPGGILFRQRRFGHRGAVFEILKFRTMRQEACDHMGSRQVRIDDPRVTRLGRLLRRTSLDELPQLFNVLKGDMALVGPRPHPIGMALDQFLATDDMKILQGYRLRVKPGLTGLAQVHGWRGPVDSAAGALHRLLFDKIYVERCSLLLDLWVIGRTIPMVLFSRANAY